MSLLDLDDDSDDRLLSPTEASRQLGVTRARLDRLTKEGRIAATPKGPQGILYYQPSELEALKLELAEEQAEKAAKRAENLRPQQEKDRVEAAEAANLRYAKSAIAGATNTELEKLLRERREQRHSSRETQNALIVGLGAALTAALLWKRKQQ